MTTATEILAAARVLTADERALIAHELLLSLGPETDDEDDVNADDALAAEIRRRSQEIRDGVVELRDWSDVLSDLRNSVRDKA